MQTSEMDTDWEEEKPSKSQKKRDATALQAFGIQLIDLNTEKLDLLPLSIKLRHAIDEAKLIKSHGAKRRQAQLIGKLMRTEDYLSIREAFLAFENEDRANTALFHEIEDWRTRLITGGKDALTEFIDFARPEDIQQLKQLITKAILEQQKATSHGAGKALFRLIRSCLSHSSH